MLIADLSLPAPRFSEWEWKHWPKAALLATMLGLYLLAGLSLAGISGPESRAAARVSRDLPRAAAVVATPPRPEAIGFRKIDPTDAVAFNASIPLSSAANPAAAPFRLRVASAGDRGRALQCLTSAVYYEAGAEPTEGQRAVAQVVLNRVRHPAYPSTVCGVVFEGSQRATGCQFTFTCDGSLRRAPAASYWERARKVAEAALDGQVYAPVGWATHYHTNWVVPYWSSSLTKAANVGTHIFYRWTGGWGRSPAFVSRHAGIEPDVSALGRRTDAALALAGADAGTVDALAKAEAAEANVDSIDSFQRAVLRRYEPASRQGVAAVLASQTPTGDAIPVAHRWALTGAGSASGETPLGQKAKASPAKPACLEGVRKTGDAAAEAKPLAC